MTREEIEMRDVEHQMEMQLVETHVQVERIIGERYEDVVEEDTNHVKETRKFLVKVCSHHHCHHWSLGKA